MIIVCLAAFRRVLAGLLLAPQAACSCLRRQPMSCWTTCAA
jgi:hypothetical protein